MLFFIDRTTHINANENLWTKFYFCVFLPMLTVAAIAAAAIPKQEMCSYSQTEFIQLKCTVKS